MRCVVSNPVREAFVIYKCYNAYNTPITVTGGQEGRRRRHDSISEPQERPRPDGRLGQVRIWGYCRLPSGKKQDAKARGRGPATAVARFIARINAQPELKKAVSAQD